ncbi:MAG: prepilin peptidase [Firmicutes bacterium]|nr:prepilin peptidase [Bacillota bacterium]
MCKIADIVIFVLLVLCSVSDCKKKTIPLWLLLLLSLVVGAFALFGHTVPLRLRIGGVILGSLFFAVSKITKEAIGYGDSWLVLLLGVHMGYLQAICVLFAASMLAGVLSICFLWKKGWRRNLTLPFAPFLSISYLGAMLL